MADDTSTNGIDPALSQDSAAQAKDRVRGSDTARANWRNTFSSLAHRDYLFLWIGMLGIMAGMQMQMLARSYLVYDITGSATLLGVVAAGNALPMLVLSLFGGAIADRFDRKRIIQAGQIVFAALALLVGIAIYTDYVNWYHLLAAGIVQTAAVPIPDAGVRR